MGWTAHYQILRERPLTDAELVALDDYIRTANQPPWDHESFRLVVTREARTDRVLGEGLQKLPMDLDESPDHERLCTTLDGLRTIVDGVEIRITDDFDTFGFDGDRLSLTGTRGPAPVQLGDRVAFVPPSELVPKRHDAVVTTDLGSALVALARLDVDHPQYSEIAEQIAEAEPLAIARAGLAVYRDISRAHQVWRVVTAAIERLDDVAPIAEAFLRIWRNPQGVQWYSDIDFPEATRIAFVRLPEVEAQFRADLAASVGGDDSELVHRRAEQAARWLGYAGTPSALAALVRAARTLRDAPSISTNQRYHTLPGVYVGLARGGTAGVIPSLLLAFDTDALRSHHRDMLAPLAGLAPQRARPLLRRIALAGEMLYEVVAALATARDVETLRELCEFPLEHERERAGDALRSLGEEPPAVGPVPPPEALVTHPSATVRDAALHAVQRTKNPALMTSIVAARALESAINRRFGGPSGSYGEYMELLPEHLRYAPHDKQLAELLSGRISGLPPQIIWPSVQPIIDGKAHELALGYPTPELRLDREIVAALRDDEAVMLAALDAGIIPARAPDGPPIAFADDSTQPADVDPAVVDALLDALAREEMPPPEIVDRAQLRRDLGSLDRYDREKALRAALLAMGPREVGERLLARCAELHNSALYELADVVLPEVAKTPDGARRLADAWDGAFTLPWSSPYRADDLFRSVAASEDLFDRARDEIAAPDNGELSKRTSGAFSIFASSMRVREVVPMLVARIRTDRGKPRAIIGWRSDAYTALRIASMGASDAVATAALELAEMESIGRTSSLIEILARGEVGLELLAAAIDLPELAADATRALVRARRGDNDVRAKYLAHPFWRVRLAAAEECGEWERGRIERYAVWAAVDAAKLRVPDNDRMYARPSDAASTATWEDLARAHGRPITLAPFPPAVDGMLDGCADYRGWALGAVDAELDPALVVARVLADELDAELVAYGHVRHAAPWTRWRTVAPDLPSTRRHRRRWALERADQLPASFAALRERGPRAIAVDMPRAYLVLPPALRERFEAEEARLAAEGDKLLRGDT